MEISRSCPWRAIRNKEFREQGPFPRCLDFFRTRLGRGDPEGPRHSRLGSEKSAVQGRCQCQQRKWQALLAATLRPQPGPAKAKDAGGCGSQHPSLSLSSCRGRGSWTGQGVGWGCADPQKVHCPSQGRCGVPAPHSISRQATQTAVLDAHGVRGRSQTQRLGGVPA